MTTSCTASVAISIRLAMPRPASPTLVPHGPRPTASLDVRGMKRVGLIGFGAIGRPVARALPAGKAGDHSLAAVLARIPRDLDGFPVTDIADRFLAGGKRGSPSVLSAVMPGP